MYGKQKNGWVLFLLILGGIVLGGFIGKYLGDSFAALNWLNYGYPFGFDTIKLDLGIIIINFGFKLYINITSVIGILLSLLIYKNI